MHSDADMSPDGRWLTYDQLARLRRIDKPSAVKLATRNHWRRRKNNSGQMQVCVPADWFERSQGRRDRHVDKSTDKGAPDDRMTDIARAFSAALAAVEASHATALEALRARTERAETDLEAARRETQEAREAVQRLERAEAERNAVPPRRRWWWRR